MKLRRKHVSIGMALAVAASAAGFLAGGSSASAAESIPAANQRPAQTAHTVAAQETSHSGGWYTVERGDTLSAIAGRQYGRSGCWPGIWKANSGSVRDPDFIYPGEGLAIPVACGSSVPGGTRPVGHARDGNPGGSKHKFQASPPPADQGGYYNSVLSFGQLESLWVAAGGPAWAEWRAAHIAECESGGNRYAYNPSGATGLWQILGQVTEFGRSLYDPWVNAANAVSKFRASRDTFAQWVCQ